MKIRELEIHNYRSIGHAKAKLSDYFIVIGPNNHGKSNVLAALEFALVSAVKINEADFFKFRATGDNELWVDIVFERLTEQEKRTFEKYVRADETIKIRRWAKIDEAGELESGYNGYAQEPEEAWLKTTAIDRYTNRENVQNDLAVHPALQALLDAGGRITKGKVEEFQKNYIAAHKSEIRFNESLESTPLLGLKSVASGTLPEFFLLPPVRNLADETKVNSKTLFGRILQRTVEIMTLSDPNLIAAKTQFNTAVAGFNSRVPDGQEETSELGKLERLLAGELKGWKAKVSIEVQPPEVGKIFELGTLLSIDDGHKTLAEKKGHGLQRAVIFSLLRVWALVIKKLASDQSTTTSSRRASESVIFAVEEPEMFLHPHAQRLLASSLQEISGSSEHQVICSTHSTHFVDISRYQGIAIVKKLSAQSGTLVQQCCAALFSGPDIEAKKKSFNLAAWINPDRGELFFGRKVVLVEGPTEKTVLPYLAKRLGLLDPNVSIIDCASKHNIPLYIELLKAFDLTYYVIHDEDPVPDPIPEGWTADKIREKRHTFELNTTIRELCGGPERVFIFNDDFEAVAGVSRGMSKRMGKPIAAIDHLESITNDQIPEALVSVTRAAFL